MGVRADQVVPVKTTAVQEVTEGQEVLVEMAATAEVELAARRLAS
jgi:hypothetical protein